MLDGKHLRALFLQFNQQFFSGRLPACAIHVVPRIASLGQLGRWNKGKRLIEIQRGLSDEEAISTLLHEMAHAATNGGHGMQWKKEMIRLREAGAPLVLPDLNVSLADWDGTRVRRKHFRNVLQDALIDGADFTLSEAIRWFLRNVGGAKNITEFRGKYPWVRKVFDDETGKHVLEKSRKRL
jgi:hypothetical protein